jgi:hypothetical protein
LQEIKEKVEFVRALESLEGLLLCGVEGTMLIPQVRPAHKYPNSPWEMNHPPGGDNAVCM